MAKKKEWREDDSALPERQKNASAEQPTTPEGGQDGVNSRQPAEEPPVGEGGQVPLEERAKSLEEETSDLKDKLLRKQADFENFRKRMFRERDEAARYANAALLSDIIGVIDDFERAIRSAEESRDFNVFMKGVSMIEKQLVETLEGRWGLKRFESVGESFDPNKHEAMLRVEGPVDAKPTVVEDYLKGYYLHERVLRPAKVKVMVPASGRNEGGVAPSGGGPVSGDEEAGASGSSTDNEPPGDSGQPGGGGV
jgi:molecular chaperone GrpE